MNFSTISAILRGHWLIEPSYAKAQLPVVLSMLKRDSATHGSAGLPALDKMATLPKKLSLASAVNNVYSVSTWSSLDRLPYETIAVVDVTGPILKYGGMCSDGTVDLSSLITRLVNSDRVTGIILNVDSPGGQSDGTGLLSDTIRWATTIKPVLSIVQDGMAASAGIWIAASAQEVYASRLTDTFGSIGAFCTIYDFAKYFEDNGVKIHQIYAPQSVDKNADYRQALQGDYTLIQDELKYLVANFTKSISMSRGARLKTSGEEPFTGKMYNATDAKKMGLIDGVKPMADVVKRVQQLAKLRS